MVNESPGDDSIFAAPEFLLKNIERIPVFDRIPL
jgi:hypothetical protein